MRINKYKVVFILFLVFILAHSHVYAQRKITLTDLPVYLRDSIIRHDTLNICELGLYLVKFNIQGSKIVNVHFSKRTLSRIKTGITHGISNINNADMLEYDEGNEEKLYIIPVFINMLTCERGRKFEFLHEPEDTIRKGGRNPKSDSIYRKIKEYRDRQYPDAERLFQSSAELFEFDDGTVLSNKDCRILDKIHLEAIY